MNYLLKAISRETIPFGEADNGGTGAPLNEGGGDAEGEDTPAEGSDEGGTDEDDGEEYEFEGSKLKLPKAFAKFVKEGVLADKDYRFKTGQTAEEKRAAENERSRYQTLVKDFETRLKASEPQKPDSAMLDPSSEKYDRDAYYRARDQYDVWKSRMDAATEARAEEDRKSDAESRKARSERMGHENSRLLDKIPEWKDDAKYAAGMIQLRKYGSDNGVSSDEFKGIDDHRTLVMMRKAMLYDEGVKKAVLNKSKDEPSKPPPAPIGVKRIGGGNPGPGALSDRQSTDAWMKTRDAIKAKQNGARR